MIIDIAIPCESWSAALEDVEKHIREAAQKTLEVSGFEHNLESPELSIVLADNALVQTLNRDYRSKDKPTNVLSFPQHEPDVFTRGESVAALGDVVLGFETIEEEALSQKKSLQDHTLHLVVHGLLHLLGFDHEQDEDAQIMETLEIRVLESLGIKNPYEITNYVR